MSRHHVLKVAVLAAGLGLPALATQSLLVVETAPQITGLGRGYDLLQNGAPFGRTYSGASSLKGKTELGVSTVILPDNFSVQNLGVVLGRPLLPGLRLGGYLTYLNTGAFNELDVKGSFLRSLSSSDLFFGFSALWDASSASFLDRSPKWLKGALGHTAAGLNLNYYGSEFDKDKTQSFLVDFNIASRFPVPQIGQARRLVTVEDLEVDRARLKLALDRAQAGGPKGPRPAEVEAAEKALKSFETIAPQRIADLTEVASQRREIYRIDRDEQVDLLAGDVSSFTRKAQLDLSNQHRETLALVAENERTVQGILTEAQGKLSLDLGKYSEGLLKLGGMASGEATSLRKTFDAFVENEYDPEPVDKIRARFVSNAKEYTAGLTDNWFVLAKKAWGKEEWAPRLLTWNASVVSNASLSNRLPRGTKIKAPEPAYFEALDAREEKLAKLKKLRSGFEDVVAKSNDTWSSLAQTHLGTSKLVKDLLAANRLTKERPIKAGETVRIPLFTEIAKRNERAKAFAAEVASRKASVSKSKPDGVTQLLWEGFTERIDQKMQLYTLSAKAEADRQAAELALGNLLLRELSSLQKAGEHTARELEKIQLRRRLDQVNSGSEKSVREAAREYKSRERALFRSFLSELYTAKEVMIVELGRLSDRAADERKDGAKRLSDLQVSAQNLSTKLALLEAGKDKAATEAVAKANSQALKALQEALQDRLLAVQSERKLTGERLSWRTYLTEMVYRGGGPSRDTLALGVSLRNMGTQINYGLISENLPFAWSGDLNYEVVHVDRHDVVLYGHYGSSTIEGDAFGGGLAYRYLGKYEGRLGVSIENNQPVLAGNISALLELGLMNYRLDVGAQYRESYGAQFSVGLGIVF